jgi:hypothetical protein
VFLSVAGGCKTRIPKPFSLLTLARRCRVLRSQWCQRRRFGVRVAQEPSSRKPGCRSWGRSPSVAMRGAVKNAVLRLKPSLSKSYTYEGESYLNLSA